jgi:hypothetical protein
VGEMVEKRTLTIIALAIIVWASIATSFTAYYYLEMNRQQKELNEKQQLLSEIAKNYKESLNKQDMLLRDYNALLGDYYIFTGENYSSFVERYIILLSNLSGNYTLTLNNLPKLKETYDNLLNAVQALTQVNVTRGDFEPLLMEFNDLLTSLAAKGLESLVGETITIKVNLCIDYGNGTREWHNVSTSPGITLFDLTQQVAQIEYDYYPTMQPGHVLMKTINGVAPSPAEWKYWFWYYWDENSGQWVFGQVGCDAWTLRDNGTYRWIYKGWGDP